MAITETKMSNISGIVEYLKNNDLEKVKQCIEKDNSLVDARDEESKFTLLMICAKKGYFDIAKFLIENGANLNDRSRTGITALMFACAEKQIEIAKYLKSDGTDLFVEAPLIANCPKNPIDKLTALRL